MWARNEVARISIFSEPNSKTANVVFEGQDDGEGSPWEFSEEFKWSNVPSALLGFAAGLLDVRTGVWR